MSTLFYPPHAYIPSSAGFPQAGALLYFYTTATSTPKNTYSDSALTIPNANPVVADAGGVWPAIYLSQDVNYRVTARTALGTLIYTQDDVPGPLMTQSGVGAVLYPPIAAEGSTVVQAWYPYGVVDRYGINATPGTTDMATAFASAALICATYPMLVRSTPNGYVCNTPFVLPANGTMRGVGRATIKTTVAGNHIVSASGVGNLSVDGIVFQGAGSATPPSSSIGGFASTSTGLVTFTTCTDVRITNCEAKSFYNGFVTFKCTRVWVNFNRVTNWLIYGILGSLSNEASFDNNDVRGCDTATGTNCYGIMVTGDEVGGNPSKAVSISFNKIQDIASWDGIMTHDVNGLTIVGNDIRNVRNGIDATYTVTGLKIRNATISGNYVEATTTNNWAAVAASSVGIYLTGIDASNLIDSATVSGNTVRNFGNITGSTISGSPGNIVMQFINDGVCTGNLIEDVGTTGSYAGIYAPNTVNSLAITGNVLRGSMPSAGIRLASSTVGTLSIMGNCINQVTTSDAAINIASSTVASFAIGLNPTNSTVPFTQSASTLTYSGQFIGAPVVARVVVTYNAAMTPNAALGSEHDITVTDGVAFTINNPSNGVDGQRITITIRNTFGVIGAVTWGANYKLSAWTQPANGFSRSIDFRYNGSIWLQVSQTGVDVAN